MRYFLWGHSQMVGIIHGGILNSKIIDHKAKDGIFLSWNHRPGLCFMGWYPNVAIYFTNSWLVMILWEYTIRTWEIIQSVQTFLYELNYTIHSTYGFFCANCTKWYIVCTDFPYKLYDTIHCTYGSLEVLKGSCMNNMIRVDCQCLYANVFSFKLYFLLLRNKISLQYVESLNRTFLFSPCSFSFVIRSN